MFRRTETHVYACSADDLWNVVRWASRLPEWHHHFADLQMRSEFDGTYRARDEAALQQRVGGRFSLEIEHDYYLALSEPIGPNGSLRIEWAVTPLTERSCQLRQRVEASSVAGRMLGAAASMEFAPDAARLARLVGVLADDPRRFVIAGGSGFLGQQLAASLQTRGHDVVILTRQEQPELPFTQVEWDGRTVGPWAEELAADDVSVVNLAGELVDVRPTSANIQRLRASRVDATRALVEASKRHPVDRWLQASTTAIWSDGGNARIDESTPPPTGAAALPQMTGVAEAWERAIDGARARRTTILRTSLVLDQDCPVFDRFVALARLGVGGAMGDGDQWVSWIHIDDWLAIADDALGIGTREIPDGVIAATSPHPVTNREFMTELRKRLAPGKFGVPMPAPLVKLGAAVLRTDPQLALTGRRVVPTRLLESGFEFEYPTLDDALLEILT